MHEGFRPSKLVFALAPRVARAVVAILGVAVLAWPSQTLAKHRGPTTGLRTVAFAKVPPDFTFDTGAGPTHLAALLGRPVVLSFWASWCEPCRAELPAFGHLREQYGNAVTLLTISDEPAGTARAFLQAHHFDLPVVEDPDRKIFETYSITPIPVTIVLRPDGAVSYVSIGETSYDELQAAVAATLTTPE